MSLKRPSYLTCGTWSIPSTTPCASQTPTNAASCSGAVGSLALNPVTADVSRAFLRSKTSHFLLASS